MSKRQWIKAIFVLLFVLIGVTGFFYMSITSSTNKEPVIIYRESVANSHAFEATIYENGLVVLKGSRVPVTHHVQEVRISKNEVTYLTTKMLELDIFNTNKPTEGLVVWDGGSITLSSTIEGKNQEISHYIGDPGISRELVDFEKEIRELVGIQDLLQQTD